MKSNKELTKKFNKISKVIQFDKFLHNEIYCFDNGQVEKMVDIRKDNMKYTIIKLNKDIQTKDYLVFMIMSTNDKFVTHQLKQEITGKIKSNKYFNYLCTYIEDTSNNEIIDRCYEELLDFPRKNFITKVLGI